MRIEVEQRFLSSYLGDVRPEYGQNIFLDLGYLSQRTRRLHMGDSSIIRRSLLHVVILAVFRVAFCKGMNTP